MKFCDSCGSYMRKTSEGLWCPKCGKLIRIKLELKAENMKEKRRDAVYVVNKNRNDHAKFSQICPKCGNAEAIHWFSTLSGEHAGVRRERTVEHFKCTKCSHSWTKSS